MKMVNRIITFLLLLFVTQNMHSQIQREFGGFELGISTKKEVTESLESQGIKFEHMAIGVLLMGVNYDNISWTSMGLMFDIMNKNKLFEVRFLKFMEPSELRQFYETTGAMLKNKYGKYYVEEESNPDKVYFRDDKTDLWIEYTTQVMECVEVVYHNRNK